MNLESAGGKVQGGGTVFFAYDPVHAVLYSANHGDLWRVTTK
jgi:hypothetical protein